MIKIKYMNDQVTDGAIMKQHGITWVQLYRLKHNNIGRHFILDGLKYTVTSPVKKPKPLTPDVENPIVLPEAHITLKCGRIVNFIIDNVKPLKILPDKNTFRTFMTIYNERMTKTEFINRVGISRYTLKNKIGNCQSFRINGVLVLVDRVVKV